MKKFKIKYKVVTHYDELSGLKKYATKEKFIYARNKQLAKDKFNLENIYPIVSIKEVK